MEGKIKLNNDQENLLERVCRNGEVIADEIIRGKDARKLQKYRLVTCGYFSLGVFIKATDEGIKYLEVLKS